MVVYLWKLNIHMKLWVYSQSGSTAIFFLKEKCLPFFFFFQGPLTRVTLFFDDSSALWTLHWAHSFSLYRFLRPSICSDVDWRSRNEKGVIVSKKKAFCFALEEILICCTKENGKLLHLFVLSSLVRTTSWKDQNPWTEWWNERELSL